MCKGKVAIVTGSSRGIGAATAKALAAKGASVVVNFLTNAEAAQSIVHEIKKTGGKAIAIQADVRSVAQLQKLVKETIETFGKLDIYVNNANINFAFKSVFEMSWDEFAEKLDNELRVAFEATKLVVPEMEKNGFGRLIYLSSSLAKAPTYGFVAHGTAKAGIIAFTKYVAQELGPKGITANCILPGLVETDATAYTPVEMKQMLSSITPLGHLGQPQDIAAAITLLASEESAFITGASLEVNGGIFMNG